MLDASEQSKGGGGHSDPRQRHQRSTPHSACGRLRPHELTVGMLGEGEGVGDSILVLIEEREMVEEHIVTIARA
jgi:hypothetical protein